MGSDIHAYIEYFDGQWFKWAGRIRIHREYALFSLMAGVRSTEDAPPVFEPRGLPNDASGDVVAAYTYFIDPRGSGPEFCSPEEAEHYLRAGSRMWDAHRVIDPDYHSASFLTTDEFHRVLDAYAGSWEVPRELTATLAAMSALGESRLLFWFDN